MNTPMNPLGKVFNRDELQAIADLCVKYDTLCFADEVYQWLVYGNRKHIYIATLDGMAERTINIGSAGKTFSVTGWKTGWAVGPANLMDALQSFHHLTIRGGVSVMQEALAIAFEKRRSSLGVKKAITGSYQMKCKIKGTNWWSISKRPNWTCHARGWLLYRGEHL